MMYSVCMFRVMAAALSLTFGRTGALVGNLVFGFLIDLNCVVPIVLFSAMLFGMCTLVGNSASMFCNLRSLFHAFPVSGVLCFFLPSTGGTALD